MTNLISFTRHMATSAAYEGNVQHVPAGSAVILTANKKVLVAYLGSCVGVALCDRVARVGGLLHLLLPEHPHSGPPDIPYRYATTGLPMFIKALVDAGAEKKRLEAWVAGGAFPGSLTAEDISFNIGGRNFQVVQEILLQHRVVPRQLEVGGYFGCRMSLDPWKWEASTEPLLNTVPDNEAVADHVEPLDVEKAVQRVRPIPQVALKIIHMLRDDRFGFGEIADEVRKDQTITATLLKLCNSSLFGLNRRVDSVDQALVLLGEKQILRLVFSAASEMFFTQTGGGYALSMGGLYQHALGTALVAEAVAKFTGKSRSETAYTAGLLHDIGKVVLDQAVSKRKPLFYYAAHNNRMPMGEIEIKELGIRHTDAGELLARLWGLPQNLQEVIKHHHEPELASINPDLVRIVNIADVIMFCFKVGLDMDYIRTDKLAHRLRIAGFHPSSFSYFLHNLSEAFFNAFLPYQNGRVFQSEVRVAP